MVRRATCLVAAGLGLAGAALAQSTAMLMPEGSKDLTLGIVFVDAAGNEGGSSRHLQALPTASGQWSNGVFAQIGALGWDVTDDPTADYGPILTYNLRSRRSDGAGRKTRLALEGGAFYSLMFTREIHFGSRLMYGGAADGRGLQLRLGADVSYQLGTHDTLTFSPGLTLADARYMQATYGIDAPQAAHDGLPAYQARAGVRGVALDVDWSCELSTRFTLDTGVSVSRLVGSAAHSPLIDERVEASLFTALSWHF